MGRIIMTSFLLAYALMRAVVTVKLIKNQGVTHETTLLAGYWHVGEVGMRVFLVLWGLARIGFVVALAALVAGWVETRVGLSILIGAGLSSLLLDVLAWPASFWLAFWLTSVARLAVVAFVLAVVFGVISLRHVTEWFVR